MTQTQTKIEWEPNARQKYEKMITKIPFVPPGDRQDRRR